MIHVKLLFNYSKMQLSVFIFNQFLLHCVCCHGAEMKPFVANICVFVTKVFFFFYVWTMANGYNFSLEPPPKPQNKTVVVNCSNFVSTFA